MRSSKFSIASACLLPLLLLVSSPLYAAESLRPLEYNNPGLTVDLGVGLWAWPLPMDYDSDGDLDLVVVCTDKPYNGTYFFENPGGEGKMPRFKPGVLIGAGPKNIQISYVDGQPRLLVPGYEYTGFLGGELKERRKVYPTTKINNDKGRTRANQWKLADYDGDGKTDLIVGVGLWGDYGWDDAYNDAGEWTNGPLHGNVYLIRNVGTESDPQYEKPRKVKAGGQQVDVFGMPSPNFADFDGDGDLDLLCGEFLDGFTYFENTGSRTKPVYAEGKRLQHDGQPLVMDLQMTTPTAVDWDGDGDQDLFVGDEDGRVAFIENTGRTVDGVPQFLPPAYFQQEADLLKFGALVTPVAVDWDGDGDEDLICGNTAGYIGYFENVDGGNPPRWAAPVRLSADGEVIRIQAGRNGSIQGPAEAKWGYTTLSVADWDQDGLPDLVVNSIWGKVIWYRNVGTRENPKLASARPIEVQWPGKPPKPAWNWWNPQENELVTQWRTTPVVNDFDEDGFNDLVMLDHEGFLALYRRAKRGQQLVLMPGERLFVDEEGKPLRLNERTAGKSGRRKLCVADWDGDGRRDLLVNSVNADWYRNVSEDGPPWVLEYRGKIDDRPLASHSTSPTTVDWNKDGRADLLLGAEDGHIYYLANQAEARSAAKGFNTDSLEIISSGVQWSTLVEGSRAFSNRDYTWFDVPERLNGWRYTRGSGGEPMTIDVAAREDAVIYLATAPSQEGILLTGWDKVDGLTLTYTDKNRTRIQVFRRDVRKGEKLSVPQGNWAGGMLLLRPAVAVESKASPEEFSSTDANGRPNVLFIAVDDLRAELGCYGDTIVKSPHIDKLAARGTLFDRAYCQQAVCNPSRASLLTGLRPSTLGVWDLPTHFREKNPNVVTLPQHFKQNGYFTRNIGKMFHNWHQDDYRGDALSWSVPSVMHYNTHGTDKPQVKGELPPNLARTPRCEMRDVPDNAYFDGRIAAMALDALGELSRQDEPWFLGVGFWKPHAAFNAPKRYWDLYDRDTIKPAANPDPPRDVPEIALHDSREILRGFKEKMPSDGQARELRHGYYAAISYVDAQVGKVIDELDRLRLADNTIIVFWSDHGYHLGEHALWAKTSNFELDARVPLIIATPKHAAGQRADALVEMLDLYPTLADLCGLPSPDHVEGVSLRPVLENPKAKVKPAAFTWHPRPAYPPQRSQPDAMGYSMRTDRFRYTEWRNAKTGQAIARELYDHDRDAGETINLAGESKYAEIVVAHSKQLRETHPQTSLSEVSHAK